MSRRRMFRYGINADRIRWELDPHIEDLEKQAALPISHQSSDAFRRAASTMKRLLKEYRTEARDAEARAAKARAAKVRKDWLKNQQRVR
jgi:hypothetical protein